MKLKTSHARHFDLYEIQRALLGRLPERNLVFQRVTGSNSESYNRTGSSYIQLENKGKLKYLHPV